MNKKLIKISSELVADDQFFLHHVLDNNIDTLFLSVANGKYPKDIYFEFPESIVLDRIDFFTNHPTNEDGKVNKYEILYKNNTSAKEWRSAYISNTYSSKGIRIAKFEPILAKNICLRIHSSSANKVAINHIDFYTREDLKEKLLEIFEDIDCKKIIDSYSLKDIREFRINNTEFKFIGELCEVGKYIRLNKAIENVKTIKVQGIQTDISAEEFFQNLKSNKPLFITPLNIFVEKQTEVLLITDKSTDVYIIDEIGKDIVWKKERLGKGMNIIYSKDISGDLYLINNRVDLEINVYNPNEKMNFKLGDNRFSEILKSNNSNENIFVEGKNFNAHLSKKWLVENFNENDFVQGIENLDTVLDYIYFLMERTDVYSQNIISFKTLFLQGKNTDKEVSYEKTDLGSYICFKNSPEKFFDKNIKNIINEDFGTLISDLFINEDILGIEVAKVLKFLLKQELYIRYLRMQPQVEDSVLSVWSKIRLVYGTERLLPKLIRNLTEPTLDNLVLVASKTLERNLSIYFKETYSLTEDTIKKCEEYPSLHIDINLINYQNQREYHLEEIKIFNDILRRNQ